MAIASQFFLNGNIKCAAYRFLVSFGYYIFWTLHQIAESRVFENGCILVGFGRAARTMGAEGEQECGRAVLFNAACCSLRPAVCRGITLLRLTSSLFLCPPLSRKRRRRVNPRSSIAEELLCLEKGENTSQLQHLSAINISSDFYGGYTREHNYFFLLLFSCRGVQTKTEVEQVLNLEVNGRAACCLRTTDSLIAALSSCVVPR